MTRLKDATFESNAITGTDAFTSTAGSPTVDSSSLMRGTYCARTNWTGSANVNGIISSLGSASEIYVSFYIRVASYPAATARIVQSSNGSTQFNITMTSAGVMNLRNNTTTIASSFMTASTNTTYRIGIRFKKESSLGAADGIIELYHATGDTAFGSADYTSSTYSMNTSANAISSINFGQSNGASTTGDIYWDSIRIDDTAMPNPDGATDTPMTVSKTVTGTPAIVKGVGKPVSITSTITNAITKLVSKPISITSTITAAVTKLVSKPISVIATISNTVTKLISKPISITSTVSNNVIKSIEKPVSITSTITAACAFVASFPRTINITVTTSSVIVKSILKPIQQTVTVGVAMLRDIGRTFSLTASSTIESLVGRGYYTTISVVSIVTATVTQSFGFGKLISITVTTAVSVQRLLALLISVPVNASVSISKAISVIKSLGVSVSVIFSKSTTSLGNIIKTHLNRNIGTIALDLLRTGATNTHRNIDTIALSLVRVGTMVLGRNYRTIDLEGMKDDSS